MPDSEQICQLAVRAYGSRASMLEQVSLSVARTEVTVEVEAVTRAVDHVEVEDIAAQEADHHIGILINTCQTMKKTKFILATAMLTIVCSTAKAQYDEDGYYRYDGYNTNYRSNYSYEYSEDWGNFYVEYSPLQLTSTANGVDSKNFNTATIGFSYDFQLGYSPVYIDAGFETSGSWHSKRYADGEKYSMTIAFSKIPVNFAFRWNPTENFGIVPYAGVHVKYNIYGEDRVKYTNGDSESWNLFDRGRTYDDDYNRFQFGYQAGLKMIIYNCFSIGAAWKADLTPFCKYYDNQTKKEEKERFQGFAFSLAYCF